MIRNIKNQILWIAETVKLSFIEMLSFRKAFLLQVLGMTINNTGFLVVWYLFFEIFEEVNGWNFKEMIGLNGIAALVYGLVFSVGAGSRKLSKKINYGQLDTFLTQPKSVLLNVIFSHSHISALGDILSGALFLTVYIIISDISLQTVLVLPLLIILGTFIFVGFVITAESLAFWIPASEDLSKTLFEFFLGPSLYPNKSFTGIVRIFFTFFIPALFLAGKPIDMLLTENFSDLWVMIVIAIFWLAFSAFVFYRGLKRYESGNLVR